MYACFSSLLDEDGLYFFRFIFPIVNLVHKKQNSNDVVEVSGVAVLRG